MNSSSHYKALTRRYRPQRFQEVLGQDPLVTTLKNALMDGKVSHAYLFSGSRGTGKTTLARILAKALNCQARTKENEPCDTCSSCKEIAHGHSMDVIEVDGASNRGIDDIRKINETISFSPSSHFKIYIIDEVHMLTKEAFNALLKTLEEPPENVKFFFATTEPHKVPATIISRCQRFNLRRITEHIIVEKLQAICDDLKLEAEAAALHLIAHAAQGGLRDAESLLDQAISFHGSPLTLKATQDILGVPDRSLFFRLDRAGKDQKLIEAYEIADEVYGAGKNLNHFLSALVEHYRILLHLLASPQANAFPAGLNDQERTAYAEAATYYQKEQVLDILEQLLSTQKELKDSPAPQVTIEMALLYIIRSHSHLPLALILQKLAEVEKKLESKAPAEQSLPPASQAPAQPPKPKPKEKPASPPPTSPPKKESKESKAPPPPATPPKKEDKGNKESAPPRKKFDMKTKSRHDTLMRFAAVELNGMLKKTN